MLRAQRAVQALAAQARRARRAAGARARAGARTATRAVLDATATRLEGDAVVWACGPWLGRLFGELVPLQGHPAGAAVLRRRAGLALARRARLGRLRPRDVRHGRPRRPRRQGRARQGGPAAGPGRRAARRPARTEPRVREYLAHRFPALADAPLKEGRCCRYELSRGLQLHRRPPPRARAHVDRRRRLGPRLQARPGARRADRGRAARRRAAARALRARRARRRPLVQDRGLRR